jgi:hypothetical protein
MKKPTPSENLKLRIATLKAKKELQEEELQASFKELSEEIKPASLAKAGLQSLVQATAAGAALKTGSRFLASTLLKRYGGKFGTAAAALLLNASDKYPEKTGPKLLSNLGKLFKRKKPLRLTEKEDEEMFV